MYTSHAPQYGMGTWLKRDASSQALFDGSPKRVQAKPCPGMPQTFMRVQFKEISIV